VGGGTAPAAVQPLRLSFLVKSPGGGHELDGPEVTSSGNNSQCSKCLRFVGSLEFLDASILGRR
jgi:hypothetical protein